MGGCISGPISRGIQDGLEPMLNFVRQNGGALADIGTLALALLLLAVLLFWKPIAVIFDIMGYLGLMLTQILLLFTGFLLILRFLAPGISEQLWQTCLTPMLDYVLSTVRKSAAYARILGSVQQLFGEDLVATLKTWTTGSIPVATRAAKEYMNGFAFVVVGPKNQGKSKLLSFLFQDFADGTPAAESKPIAPEDGGGVTKSVAKIGTKPRQFGGLGLNECNIHAFDAPGVFDDATWSSLSEAGTTLRNGIEAAVGKKSDTWAVVLVIRVGGERMDQDQKEKTVKVVEDAAAKFHLDLDEVLQVTFILLTGLDELKDPTDDKYVSEKFEFDTDPTAIKRATNWWLGQLDQSGSKNFIDLVSKCQGRVLLWSNESLRMFGPRQREQQKQFDQLQVDAFIKMVSENRHGKAFKDVVEKAGGCFPATARVQLEGGRAQAVSEIQVGEQLLTSCGYSTYFLNSHQAPDIVTDMVEISSDSGHVVTASPDHYIKLHRGGYKKMENVKVGDAITVLSGGRLHSSAVVTVARSTQTGLYNPFTLQGDLVVNDVLMSCHSSWFLEGFISESLIPEVYQALLTPLRLLYYMLPTSFSHFAAAFAGHEVSLDKQPVQRILAEAVHAVMGPGK